MTGQVQFEAIAEDALLLRFGNTIDVDISARVLQAAAALQALPQVECIPAYASVLLRFDTAAWSTGALPPHDAMQNEATRILRTVTGDTLSRPRDVVIPVCYGGEYGPDLAAVAAHAGMVEAEVVARHAAGNYRVAMIGFAPGFPYLLGLDPLLEMPRREQPRQHVPAGSVAIGGRQTGIYPVALPGGWQLIGRTPSVLFDVAGRPPSRLSPGDRVRFAPVDAARFETIAHGDGQ